MSQPHPTKGAEIYCCIPAGGILAATEVCCVHTAPCWSLCTPLVCPVGCSLFVVLTVLFQRPRDFPRDATAAVTRCSSLCTLRNPSLSDKVRCQ